MSSIFWKMIRLAALWPALTLTGQAQKAGELKFEPYVFEAGNQQKVDAELGTLVRAGKPAQSAKPRH